MTAGSETKKEQSLWQRRRRPIVLSAKLRPNGAVEKTSAVIYLNSNTKLKTQEAAAVVHNNCKEMLVEEIMIGPLFVMPF